MDEGLRDEFLVRFYRWAMEDAIREVKDDCPLIRSVHGVAACTFLAYIDLLGQQQRVALIKPLVKRMHLRALEVCGESLDKHEQELIDEYLNATSEIGGRYVDRHVFTLKNKASKRKLRTVVKEKLLPVCGPIVRRDSSDLWDHARSIEEWTIFTGIDLGGSGRLRYEHYIRESRGATENLNGVGFITLVQWMGISGGQTKWNLLVEGEEEYAADALAKICSHFLNALPLLLKDLG
jgi:hypothetical protein